MNLFGKLLAVSCLSLAVLIGCSNDSSSNLEVSGEGGSINIQLVADAASDFSDVASTAEVKISGEGMPTLTRSLTVTASGISGSITGIPAGTDRKFEVFVYDELNKLCYYGGAFGNVAAGGTASIALTLYQSTGEGGATITGSIESGNVPPVVSLTSPVNNSQYSVGEVISLAATASDADGSVSNVSFYNGGTLIGTDASTPFTYTFTSTAAGTLSLTAVATDNSGAATRSAVVSVTVRAVSSVSYQINVGGSAVSPYTADAYFSGGTTASITSAVTTTGVVNPAPAAVYQTERYGNVTYTIPNLTAGTSYKVRLHFAELYWTASGKRSFNVSIMGSQVMSNFDIYVAAGGAKKAIVKEFTATANAGGQMLIVFTKVTDNAQVCAIEILPNQSQNFTITYNLDGGTNNAGNPVTYTAATPTITLLAPVKVGSTFGGWYANSGLTGTPVTTIPVGSTGDKTFWAKWLTSSYTITYNLDGGTNNAGNPATYTATTPTITLASPTKAGYTFGGWFANSGLTGTPVTTIPTGSTGDKTFWAKWTTISYAITYNLNGGTNSSNNPASYVISGSTIPLYNPSRTGYTFDGWYSDAGFTTPVSGIPAGSTGARTFWAKWTAISYAITYYLDGGTNSSNNPATYTYSGSTILIYNPSKTCYSFDGWYSDANFTTLANTIPPNSTGSKSFWVKWIPNGPIISTQPVNTPVSAGDEGTLICVGPAGATYQWYLASSGAAFNGATSSSFTYAPGVTTSYYCIVRSPTTGCTTQSNTATLLVF